MEGLLELFSIQKESWILFCYWKPSGDLCVPVLDFLRLYCE